MQQIMTTTTLSGTDALASALRPGFRGAIFGPGQSEYDEARRVWNATADRRPSLIARPADAADVAHAVRTARRLGLPLTVKSGGHSVAGQSVADGALMLDLSGLKRVAVDPARCTARAQAGLLAGEVNRATQGFGLAVPLGDNAHVGLGGLALGGGIGWLVRRYGLAIDHLLRVELVTAGGELLHASETENADLFWGLRGGGGNFGVATSFEFDLQPLGTTLAGMLVYPGFEARSVVRDWAAYALDAPEGLTTIGMIMPAPPLPFVPRAMHGKPIVVIMAVFSGEAGEAEAAIAPLRKLGTPALDTVAPIPYTEAYRMTDVAGEMGLRRFVRSGFLPAIDAGTIDGIVGSLDGITVPANQIQIRPLGGAMRRVAADATAFPHRNQNFLVAAFGDAAGPVEAPAQQAWVDALYEQWRPAMTGVYSNFLGDEGEERIRAAYAGNYARLAALKRKYDPENFFRYNENVRPS